MVVYEYSTTTKPESTIEIVPWALVVIFVLKNRKVTAIDQLVNFASNLPGIMMRFIISTYILVLCIQAALGAPYKFFCAKQGYIIKDPTKNL